MLAHHTSAPYFLHLEPPTSAIPLAAILSRSTFARPFLEETDAIFTCAAVNRLGIVCFWPFSPDYFTYWIDTGWMDTASLFNRDCCWFSSRENAGKRTATGPATTTGSAGRHYFWIGFWDQQIGKVSPIDLTHFVIIKWHAKADSTLYSLRILNIYKCISPCFTLEMFLRGQLRSFSFQRFDFFFFFESLPRQACTFSRILLFILSFFRRFFALKEVKI